MVKKIPVDQKWHFELPLKINHKASQTPENICNKMRNISKEVSSSSLHWKSLWV